MTNLILIRPRIEFSNAMPNPPIGLGYMASILRENGHHVDIIDCAILKDSYLKVASQIKKLSPDAIGITALSPYYNEMQKLANILQKLGIPLILGGVHISALPEISLIGCGADLAVLGEGELTILELMNIWADKEKRKSIKGIAYIENGKFIRNPPRELVQNLDDLPFPAWDLINPLKYPPAPHGHMMQRTPVAPILTTRGCPYNCSYCASTNFWGNTFRRRSAQNVVDEMEYLVNEFGIREIHIWDDNFTLVRKHVVEICKEIFKRKLDLLFACPNGVRIDHLNREILAMMRRAGFYSLSFAIESGVQSILDRANKKINLGLIPKMVKIAKELGYYIPSYFIFGLPGETYKTARQSIEFAKSIPLDAMTSFIAKPLPGSKFFDDYIKTQDLSKIQFDRFFHFYGPDNRIELTDGKQKLILPRDAYREFYYRPKQLFRFSKYVIKNIHLNQFISILQNAIHFVFGEEPNK